ncbi:unnamed protein product [Owenia fusiformis]|uniref:Uncharacterized protein n=1 Tax=Owenia fusiformis TaxID=6347 RepID=A0A8S4NH45_OWEFU|nr:unnamed protein product [Owenia fusiformis]
MVLKGILVTIATLLLLTDSSQSGNDDGCKPAPPSGCVYKVTDNLPTVICNNLNLKAIPTCLPGKTHPKKLIINGNNISQITSIRYDTLEYLYIESDNVLNIVLYAFGHLSNLTVLSLRNNFITDIQRDTFIGLTHLKELYLTNNSIKTLPHHAFFYLPQLKILEINKNSIASISDGAFANLTVLSELNLRDNKLIAVPKFNNTRLDLDILNLGQNKLTEIPHEPFKTLKYLKTLYLDDNEIITLPHSAFWGLDHLKLLHLENNQLSHIWYHLFLDPWESLLEVYLHNNNIAELNPIQLPWKQLHVVTLDDNHWLCTCKTVWMKSLRAVIDNSTSIMYVKVFF